VTANSRLPDAGSTTGRREPQQGPLLLAPQRSGLPASGWPSWAERQELVERVIPIVGDGLVLGGEFECVIPGHVVCGARVRFDGGQRGSQTWRYRCGRKWRSLAEVRACVVAGAELEPLWRGTQRLWFDRCALEAGLVEPSVEFLLPTLPSSVDELARGQRVGPTAVAAIYAGFGLALRVRSLRDPGDRAFLFTPGFAGPWSGISTAAARKARVVLAGVGAIHEVGGYAVREGRYEAKLWELGHGARP
jgi:hypothetical protein